MLITDPQERAARAKEKQWLLLRFLRDEIYTNLATAGRVMKVLERATRDTISKMERAGLVVRHEVKLLEDLPPLVVVGITQLGQAEAYDPVAGDAIISKEFRPGKFSPLKLQHNLDVQRLRLYAAESGKAQRWLATDRIQLEGKGLIRPDALLLDQNEIRVAVEVERTIKTPKRYVAIMAGHLTAILQNKWDKVIWACPDQSTANKVQTIMQKIEVVDLAGVKTKVQDKHRARLQFTTYSQFIDCL